MVCIESPTVKDKTPRGQLSIFDSIPRETHHTFLFSGEWRQWPSPLGSTQITHYQEACLVYEGGPVTSLVKENGAIM